MSQILGLSLDRALAPVVHYEEEADETQRTFSVTLYQESAPEFKVHKHLMAVQQNNTTIESSRVHLYKLVAAPENIREAESQPLVMRYSGYYVTMLHSGEFSAAFRETITLGDHPLFQPRSDTNAEYAFCWILEQLHSQGCASFSDLTWPVFFSLLAGAFVQEKINLLLSDGEVLIAFSNNSNAPLHFCSNNLNKALQAGHLKFDKQKLPKDAQMVAFSDQNGHDPAWEAMAPGQFLAVDKGTIIWDSAIAAGAPLHEYEEQKSSNDLILNQTITLHTTRLSASFEVGAGFPKRASFSVSSKEQKTSIFSVEHESHYRYTAPVSNSKHLFRLHPVCDLDQSVANFQLSSSSKGQYSSFTGVFGNNATLLEITQPYTELKLVSRSIVTVNEPPVTPRHLLDEQLMIPLIWMPWDRIMMEAYLTPPELPESELQELSSYAMSFVRRNNNNLLAVLNDINNTIYKEFAYVPNSTTLSTTAFDVFLDRKGVCQDFSNLFICMSRLLNVPARYRVGYLYTGGGYDHGRAPDQTHAWVEVYLPRIGWMGFDPTNGCLAGMSHIRVACGRNYRDATPTSGVLYSSRAKETLSSFVRVILLNP